MSKQQQPKNYNPFRMKRKKAFNTELPFTETVTEITDEQKAAAVQRQIDLIKKTYENL
jgi:hypothetical protein